MTPDPPAAKQAQRTWTLVIHAGDDNTFIADERMVDQWRNHPNFEVLPVVEQAALARLQRWQELVIGVLIGPRGKKNEDAPFAKELLDELVAPLISTLQDKLAAEQAALDEVNAGWRETASSLVKDLAAETQRAERAEADLAEALGYLDNLHHYANKAGHGCTSACGTQQFLKRFREAKP